MKSLIKKYINLLTVDKLKDYALKNNINLNDSEIEFLLNLVKENYDDILINDEKYLKMIKDKFNVTEYEKIKNIYLEYKSKYSEYLS